MGLGVWGGCGGALGSAGRVIARAGAGLVLPGWELTDRLNCGVDVVDHQSRACVIRYPAQSLQTADILRGTEGGVELGRGGGIMGYLCLSYTVSTGGVRIRFLHS